MVNCVKHLNTYKQNTWIYLFGDESCAGTNVHDVDLWAGGGGVDIRQILGRHSRRLVVHARYVLRRTERGSLATGL